MILAAAADVGAWTVGGATVIGVVLLAVLVLVARETILALADRLWPVCCICGRRSGGYHNAMVERWREVRQVAVEYVRHGPESFPGRKLTPPWICGDCWADGWRPDHIHLPPELTP